MAGHEIFLVPHTHYDAVWIFNEEEYFRLNKLILERVVEIMEKNKEFTFLIEQAHLLEKLKEREPELYERIKKFVREGRIEIAGGEYLMSDLYLPQEETIVRSILLGRKFVKTEFGIFPVVMWQSDSFGLPAQFPQICKKFGYRYIAFRRGCDRKAPSEFKWKSLDGSEVLAHFMPFGYRAGLIPEKWEENIKLMKKFSASDKILFPCGSGTTVPEERLPELVKKWNERRRERMHFSLPSEFFKSIEGKKFATRRGEMFSCKYPELEVFPSTASSRIWIKLLMRNVERKILALEKMLVLFPGRAGKGCKNILEKLWKDVVFISLHDVITGTSTDEVFRRIKEKGKKLEKTIERTMKKIIESLCGRDERSVVIFNPLSFPVKEWVEAEIAFSAEKIKGIERVVCGKEEKLAEILEEERDAKGCLKRAKIGFVAELPPLGLKEYKIVEGKSKTAKRIRKGNRFRVGNFEVEILEGCRIRVYKGNKLICEGNEIVLEEECGDLYRHLSPVSGILKSETGKGLRFGEFGCKSFEIEEGRSRVTARAMLEYHALGWPYRGRVRKRILLKHKLIEIEKKIIIYKDLPRIDFWVRVKNEHPEIRVRVKFSPGNGNFLCDTQFGYVKRGRGIYPCLRWACVEKKGSALTFINFGTPEYEYDGKDIYITLLRSVSKLSSGKEGPVIPTPDALELGDYEFSYALHLDEKFGADSVRQAFIFNHKPFVFPGYRGMSHDCFEVLPDNVILSALKPGENGKFVIARICEYLGKRSTAKIRFPEKMEFSGFVDLNEEKTEKRKTEIKNRELRFAINPFEIVTLKFKPKE